MYRSILFRLKQCQSIKFSTTGNVVYALQKDFMSKPIYIYILKTFGSYNSYNFKGSNKFNFRLQSFECFFIKPKT